MRREEILHVARAAADVAGVRRVLVVGSQAVLGSYVEADLPEVATQSIEVDIVVLDDLDGKAHQAVEGALGFQSQFHASHGYYAEGVERGTARLPDGWEGRIVTLEARTIDDEAIKVHFPEVHDLCVSKLVAGRRKDRDFVSSLVRSGAVDPGLLVERAKQLSGLHAEVIAQVVHVAESLRDRFGE